MHAQRIEKGDEFWQRALLSFLLTEYPQLFTRSEIERELLQPEPDFSEQDALARAQRDLIQIGLLHEIDKLILPTRVARCFRDLELE